jgi:hypothetical protein
VKEKEDENCRQNKSYGQKDVKYFSYPLIPQYFLECLDDILTAALQAAEKSRSRVVSHY